MANKKIRDQARGRPKASPRPTPTRLTPADWDRFYKLLLTWPLRQAAGKAIIPPPEEWQPADWELQYEEQYGDGRYDQRRRDMQRVLRRLHREGRADLRHVYEILHDARLAAMDVYRKGQGIEWNRPRGIKADRMLGDLAWGLAELRVLYESFGYADPDTDKPIPSEAIRALQLLSALAKPNKSHKRKGLPESWPELTNVVTALGVILKGAPETLALAEALTKAVKKDALLNYALTAPQRRPRAGGRATPWREYVWHALLEAGVHLRQDRADLLAAVGLTESKSHLAPRK